MEYINYLNFGFDIVIVVFHVTTIFFTFHVIYCSKFDKKCTKLDRISNSFFIFLASRGFGAMVAIPYQVYLTAYWSAEGARNYNPYTLLWLGLGMLIHAYLFALSASLLTIERCFALAFPLRYNSKWFPWLTFICLTLSSIFVAFYVLGEIPLDIEKVHNCQLVPCLALKYHLLVPQYAKFFIGGLNVLGSCYLIFAMKRNNEKLVTGVSPTVYVGQLLNVFAFLNVAICSIYYSWRLTRNTNGFWTIVSRVERVSPATISTH